MQAQRRTDAQNCCPSYMESSRQTDPASESAEQPSQNSSTLAKALAPEEVRTGDYVTLLHEYTEMPSYYWCNDSTLVAPDEVIRVRYLPTADAGTPLEVQSICLPFVLVKHPSGEERPLDLRKFRVARLTKSYATRAWDAFKTSASSNSSSKGDVGSGVFSTDDVG
jgi:hypothetical protein